MRRRFFWSMLGVATLGLGVVAVLGAILGQINAVAQARAEISRQANAVAELVEEMATVEGRVTAQRLLQLLRDGQAQEGTPAGDRFVRLLSAAQRVTGGSIVDLGWIGADGALHLVRNPALGAALGFDTALLKLGEDQHRRVELPDETQALLAVAHPLDIDDRGAVTPVVIVAQRSDLIDWRDTFRGLLIPFLIAAVLSAIAARSLSSWLAARLDKLTTAAHALAEGNLEARVEAGNQGDDEVADLARSFNVMAGRLQDLQQREQEFLMSVGHDLRTPLTTIGGYAEALEEGGLAEEETRRIAGVLSRETDRLRRLVEDLMLLARLEAREFTLRPEPVDVGAHLGELADTFRARAEEARVNLTVEINGTGTVVTDADRLARIASNLLENALRYTPEAGEVALAVTSGPAGIELSVTDTGPGIDPEDVPHVFDKFYVARKYRRVRPEGSGLGLSIVKQLVDIMDGTVTAQATSGHGTRVEVEIPALPAANG